MATPFLLHQALFDTSVLVTALVDQLPNHDAGLARLASACRSQNLTVLAP